MIDNDIFHGDNKKLASSIESLLSLDAKGCLVPHGIGGAARTLLSAGLQRLTASNERVDVLERALGGMLFAFDDGVGREWSAPLLDYARTLTPAVEFTTEKPRPIRFADLPSPTNQTIDGVPREFVREGRYIVVKPDYEDDIRTERLRNYIEEMCFHTPDCVVVEADWPEYEPVCRMIEARVIGNPTELDAAKATISQLQGLVAELRALLDAPVSVTRPAHANPPPSAEPSGTHPHNDGLDEWRKPQDDQARRAELLESLAQQIYDSWQSQPGWVPWQDGMYGSKQNESRQIASRTFELALANQVDDGK